MYMYMYIFIYRPQFFMIFWQKLSSVKTLMHEAMMIMFNKQEATWAAELLKSHFLSICVFVTAYSLYPHLGEHQPPSWPLALCLFLKYCPLISLKSFPPALRFFRSFCHGLGNRKCVLWLILGCGDADSLGALGCWFPGPLLRGCLADQTQQVAWAHLSSPLGMQYLVLPFYVFAFFFWKLFGTSGCRDFSLLVISFFFFNWPSGSKVISEGLTETLIE